MSLAVATAREGCIAETLSALELAVEVDSVSASAALADDVADDNDVVGMLMQKTRIIALEEGRHSMLAWRTIHWVCSIDSAACDTVKRDVFETGKMAGVVKQRFGLDPGADEIEKAWSRLYAALVPFVTMEETIPAWTSTLDCTALTDEDNETDLTSQLVKNIIQGVYCGVQSTVVLVVKE
jgi:hypothetical protein